MKWCMRRGPFHSVALVAIATSVIAAGGLRAQQSNNLDASSATSAVPTDRLVPAVKLAPTVHPAVPSRPTDFWYVPESFPRTGAGRSESSAEKFARAARLIEAGDFAGGLPLLAVADLSGTPLASYALYYRALALTGLNRFGEAADLTDRNAPSATGQHTYTAGKAT